VGQAEKTEEMRRSIRIERHLDAPPEGVFEVISDHARYDRFDGVTRSEIVKEGAPAPNGLGAVRLIASGPLRFTEEITAYEPPRRMDYLIIDFKPGPFRHSGGSIVLAPEGDGTHVLWTSAFEVPIPVVGAAIDAVMERKLVQGFNHILDRSVELSRSGAQ